MAYSPWITCRYDCSPQSLQLAGAKETETSFCSELMPGSLQWGQLYKGFPFFS